MKEVINPRHSLSNAVELLDLERLSDPRGNLTFIEGGRHIPFDVKRVYYPVSYTHLTLPTKA